MTRIILTMLVALLAACASVVAPKSQLEAAYDTANAYVDVTKSSLQRGRITPEQAARASTNAKNALVKIDLATAALANCQPPCSSYVEIMKGLQPTLLEFEAELRKREKEQGK